MNESRGKKIIEKLQKKWNTQMLVAHLLLSILITVVASVLAIKLLQTSWLVAPAFLAASALLTYFLAGKKINEQDVVKFLNGAFPDLQESTQLALKPRSSLNTLEKIQLKKVENILTEDIPSPLVVAKRMKVSFALLVFASVIAMLLFVIPFPSIKQSALIKTSRSNTFPERPEAKLPQVKEVTITITPPAYTGKNARQQDKFNLTVEQDASVYWNITTSIKANQVQLIFSDKSILHLPAVNKEHTQFQVRNQIKTTGFYQVKVAGNTSELYRIEMIKDQLPTIVVQSPKANTTIEYGQPQGVSMKVQLSDDYGIESVFANATIASGSGEAVKFKEQKILFANFNAGGKNYQLQKQIDLKSLGLQPGDELYFYISAKDNNHQEKRSDVYIVRIEDTAQLMSMDGLVNGVDVKPEFFRSQRQIIIETEQLLKDRDTISVERFNKKSSDLGTDQKLLRLRYGKFLGEENEVEMNDDHNHDHAGQNDAVGFNDANKILDQYSHKHDNAEDATFFDAATKKQLLATLSEMWKAELQLRTLKPADALPFEYKALRLLKDLQQRTRAYVAKTGVKTTPLTPEKRLTGDLSKITQPIVQQDFQQKDDPATMLRKALGALEQARNRELMQRPEIEVLEQASIQLSKKAASEPVGYLSGLQALRRILKNNFTTNDINVAGSAFQKMIRTVASVPQKSSISPDMKLSHRYFMNLNRKND